MKSIQSSVAAIARNIRINGISKAGGNVSAFEDGRIYITPSGKDLLDICETDIVVIKNNEDIALGKKPSREWRIHKSVYESNTKNRFIVHVHSPYATALSCCRIDIPPFHFMVAAFARRYNKLFSICNIWDQRIIGKYSEGTREQKGVSVS